MQAPRPTAARAMPGRHRLARAGPVAADASTRPCGFRTVPWCGARAARGGAEPGCRAPATAWAAVGERRSGRRR